MKGFTSLPILVAVYLLVLIAQTPVYGAEVDGWIKSDVCWVATAPSKDAKVIGLIKKKAAVTLMDVGNGWAKIVFAPVRHPTTGKFIECNKCYIQIVNVTTIPGGW
jgi:hypothetical protein